MPAVSTSVSPGRRPATACRSHRASCPRPPRRSRAPRRGSGSRARTCRRWAADDGQAHVSSSGSAPAPEAAPRCGRADPVPRPCAAETAIGSPGRGDGIRLRADLADAIALVAATMHGSGARRSSRPSLLAGAHPGARVHDQHGDGASATPAARLVADRSRERILSSKSTPPVRSA